MDDEEEVLLHRQITPLHQVTPFLKAPNPAPGCVIIPGGGEEDDDDQYQPDGSQNPGIQQRPPGQQAQKEKEGNIEKKMKLEVGHGGQNGRI